MKDSGIEGRFIWCVPFFIAGWMEVNHCSAWLYPSQIDDNAGI
jgi:hypothetical protein